MQPPAQNTKVGEKVCNKLDCISRKGFKVKSVKTITDFGYGEAMKTTVIHEAIAVRADSLR